jgi:hypothetical protein
MAIKVRKMEAETMLVDRFRKSDFASEQKSDEIYLAAPKGAFQRRYGIAKRHPDTNR